MDVQNTFRLTYWLVLLTIFPLSSSLNDFVVETNTGSVKGTTLYFNDIPVQTYYGVPYAEPPVGNLRFQRTVPKTKWSDVWDATKKGPICFQMHNELESEYVDKTSEESEDCLYLNIWAPANRDEEKKAVMLWIHGGNFTYGSRNFEDGLVLAAEGDVIVVTVSYRQGMLGFFTVRTEDAPGNAAMYDQVEAMRWTKENIAAFGGDEDRITLFGQSSGSFSVSAHAVSPLSKNLFSRAVMQSGSTAYKVADDPDKNLKISYTVAISAGCATDLVTININPEAVVDCMRKLDAKTLTDMSVYQLFPQYNDTFLPENPRKSIIEGNFKNCDLLIGNVEDEGSYLVDDTSADTFGKNGKKNEHPRLTKTQGREMLTKILIGFNLDPVSTTEVVNYYLEKVKEYKNEEVLRQIYTAVGDYGLLCPPVYTAEKSAEQGNRVHYYFFTYRPNNTVKAEWMRVAHFEEVQFVFGKPLQTPEKYTNPEVELSKKMVKMWSNFAKTGNPDPEEQTWPLYSREHPSYRVLNLTIYDEPNGGPHQDNCDFFRQFFKGF